jgi:NRPS condensation-like uncharacterized protein
MRCLAHLDTTAEKEAVSIQSVDVTVDLRRYLNPAWLPVVCNLSGMERVSVQVGLQENFEETLLCIHQKMEKIKADHPGLHSAAAMEFLAQMPFPKAKAFLCQASSQAKQAGRSTVILSNLGLVSKETLCLGDTPAWQMYSVTPAMHGPAFMLGVSSYDGMMTLTVGYFEGEHTELQMKDLLSLLKEELCGK